MQLTIMTFNIQHGVNHALRLKAPDTQDYGLIDLERVSEAIRRFQPDIVSLNEVRGLSDDPCFTAQTEYIAGHAGFPYFYFGKAIEAYGRGPYGNALLSRYPFDSIETVMIPDPKEKRPNGHYETRSLIRSAIRLPEGQKLSVMNTHFGLEPDEAGNAVDTVLSLTDPSQPTLVMGDFNLTPDDAIFQRLLTVYTDSANVLDPAVIALTYPSHAPEMKIDYILGCGALTFEAATIPDLVVSDHRPYLATVNL